MRKLYKYLAACFLGIALTNCSDEDLVQGSDRIYNDGDEIEFSVSASVPSGNSKAVNSRTSYGDHTADVNGVGKININWVTDDAIDIACPEAGGVQQVSYKVPSSSNGQNVASSLIRTSGDTGLRWNGEGDHHFYSIYPSSSVFNESPKYPATMKDRPSFKLVVDAQGNRKAVGHLPKNFVAIGRTQTEMNGVKHYQVTPNMDYAFMVAQTTSNLAQVNANGLSLSYQSLATAIEFDLTANVVKNPSSSTPDSTVVIQLDRVELESMDKTDLWGDFEYDFNTSTLKNTSAGVNNHLNFYLSYDGMKDNAIILNNKDVCTVNLFLMPDQNLQAQKLKIRIWYTVNGLYKRQSTATLGKEIKCRYKYAFKNVTMPKVNVDVKGSTWFTAVDDAVYLNQLSMICAGNAFSYKKELPWSSREQVMGYEDLWNRGVRAFEFVTQSSNPNGSNNTNANVAEGLTHEHFVCGEQEWDGRPGVYGDKPAGTEKYKTHTFGEAFASLAQYLVDPDSKFKDFHNECLIIIARYHAVCDGYNPERYVEDLVKFLNTVTTTGVALPNGGKKIVVPEDRFVLLTANSTATDLKGKIAIIVRPGDDAYCKKSGVKTTGEIWQQRSSKWKDKVCFVENWGSAYDRWDTRYAGVAREATWNTDSKLSVIENKLWGLSRNNGRRESNETTYLPLLSENFKGDANDKFIEKYNLQNNVIYDFAQFNEKFNFSCTVNGIVGGGYIQEWCRVIPNDLGDKLVSGFYNGQGKGEYLTGESYRYTEHSGFLDHDDWGKATVWYRWPSSYDQKIRAIKNCFEKSVQRTGTDKDPLFINVLSGYYADDNHTNSLEPFIEYFDADIPNGKTPHSFFKAQGQGNGGNYAALACQLNYDIYTYLTSNELPQGPWGIVQMNYLGATAQDFIDNAGPQGFSNLHGANAEEAARTTSNLMQMFIANNFSFELKKDPAVQSKSARVAKAKQQEEELIFE